MQQVFVKIICQEELYCTVTEQEIKEKDWLKVRGDELLDIFNHIDNPTDTRFIQLEYAADGDANLGFTGLLEEKCLITTKTTSKTKSKWKMPLVQNKKQCFILASTLRNLEQYINNKWPIDNDTRDDFCQGMR